MAPASEALPDNVAALKAALVAERARGLEVAAELAVAQAKASEDMALIAAQKLKIAKLQRQIYGQRSERSVRLIDQLALEFEELEASATEDELAAEQAAAKTTTGAPSLAAAPSETPFPTIAARADGDRSADGLRLLRRPSPAQARRGRDADAGDDAPAVEGDRDGAGEVLLPGLRKDQPGAARPHDPERLGGPEPARDDRVREVRPAPASEPAGRALCARGRPIALSTMADAVGAVSTALDPLRRLVEAHVMAAERLHGDDTTVPVLAKGKTDTGRLWIYVRDDEPFGGAGPPAAMFHYSRDRRGEHPQAHLIGYAGILQADAYDGYNKLYLADRKPGPIREAACWAHARRKFFVLADVEENARRKAAGKSGIPLSPIAIEVVRRIDALFAIEREINGKSPEERLAVRRAESRTLVDDLVTYMREQAARLSRGHDLVKAIQYMVNRWPAFTLFLEDGRVCMSTDDAEKRESSARRSGLGRSLGRLFLPRHHHPLVGLLGTPNVVGFSLSDLLDPIVATWSRLAIFAWSAGLERSFA